MLKAAVNKMIRFAAAAHIEGREKAQIKNTLLWSFQWLLCPKVFQLRETTTGCWRGECCSFANRCAGELPRPDWLAGVRPSGGRFDEHNISVFNNWLAPKWTQLVMTWFVMRVCVGPKLPSFLYTNGFWKCINWGNAILLNYVFLWLSYGKVLKRHLKII